MSEIAQGAPSWSRSGLCGGTPQDIYLVIVKCVFPGTGQGGELAWSRA